MIPGCSYLTREGIEVIYLGFGNFFCDDGSGAPLPFCDFQDRYVYLRVKDFERCLRKGEITPDLSYYCGKSHIERRLSIRIKPRPLQSKIPIKQFFDKSFSTHLIFEDASYGGKGSAIWHFVQK